MTTPPLAKVLPPSAAQLLRKAAQTPGSPLCGLTGPLRAQTYKGPTKKAERSDWPVEGPRDHSRVRQAGGCPRPPPEGPKNQAFSL